MANARTAVAAAGDASENVDIPENAFDCCDPDYLSDYSGTSRSSKGSMELAAVATKNNSFMTKLDQSMSSLFKGDDAASMSNFSAATDDDASERSERSSRRGIRSMLSSVSGMLIKGGNKSSSAASAILSQEESSSNEPGLFDAGNDSSSNKDDNQSTTSGNLLSRSFHRVRKKSLGTKKSKGIRVGLGVALYGQRDDDSDLSDSQDSFCADDDGDYEDDSTIHTRSTRGSSDDGMSLRSGRSQISTQSSPANLVSANFWSTAAEKGESFEPAVRKTTETSLSPKPRKTPSGRNTAEFQLDLSKSDLGVGSSRAVGAAPAPAKGGKHAGDMAAYGLGLLQTGRSARTIQEQQSSEEKEDSLGALPEFSASAATPRLITSTSLGVKGSTKVHEEGNRRLSEADNRRLSVMSFDYDPFENEQAKQQTRSASEISEKLPSFTVNAFDAIDTQYGSKTKNTGKIAPIIKPAERPAPRRTRSENSLGFDASQNSNSSWRKDSNHEKQPSKTGEDAVLLFEPEKGNPALLELQSRATVRNPHPLAGEVVILNQYDARMDRYKVRYLRKEAHKRALQKHGLSVPADQLIATEEPPCGAGEASDSRLHSSCPSIEFDTSDVESSTTASQRSEVAPPQEASLLETNRIKSASPGRRAPQRTRSADDADCLGGGFSSHDRGGFHKRHRENSAPLSEDSEENGFVVNTQPEQSFRLSRTTRSSEMEDSRRGGEEKSRRGTRCSEMDDSRRGGQENSRRGGRSTELDKSRRGGRSSEMDNCGRNGRSGPTKIEQKTHEQRRRSPEPAGRNRAATWDAGNRSERSSRTPLSPERSDKVNVAMERYQMSPVRGGRQDSDYKSQSERGQRSPLGENSSRQGQRSSSPSKSGRVQRSSVPLDDGDTSEKKKRSSRSGLIWGKSKKDRKAEAPDRSPTEKSKSRRRGLGRKGSSDRRKNGRETGEKSERRARSTDEPERSQRRGRTYSDGHASKELLPENMDESKKLVKSKSRSRSRSRSAQRGGGSSEGTITLRSRAILLAPHELAGELVIVSHIDSDRQTIQVAPLGKDAWKSAADLYANGETSATMKISRALSSVPFSQVGPAPDTAFWAQLRIHGNKLRLPMTCHFGWHGNGLLCLRVKLDSFPGFEQVVPIARAVLGEKRCSDWEDPALVKSTLGDSSSRQITTKVMSKSAISKARLSPQEFCIDAEKQAPLLEAMLDYKLIERTTKKAEHDGTELDIFKVLFSVGGGGGKKSKREKSPSESKKKKKSKGILGIRVAPFDKNEEAKRPTERRGAIKTDEEIKVIEKRVDTSKGRKGARTRLTRAKSAEKVTAEDTPDTAQPSATSPKPNGEAKNGVEKMKQQKEAEEEKLQQDIQAKLKKREEERRQRLERVRQRIAAENAAEQLKERLEKTYEWYNRLGKPSKNKFKEKITKDPTMFVSEEDIELLPWTASGSMVNVAKYKVKLLSF